MTTGEKIKHFRIMKIANALGISINVFMDFEAEKTRTEVLFPLQSKYPLKTLCSIISWAYI